VSPRTLDRLLVATLAVLTWEKIRWNTPGVTLTLTNILATAFVACFVVDRVRRRDTAVTPAAMTKARRGGAALCASGRASACAKADGKSR